MIRYGCGFSHLQVGLDFQGREKPKRHRTMKLTLPSSDLSFSALALLNGAESGPVLRFDARSALAFAPLEAESIHRPVTVCRELETIPACPGCEGDGCRLCQGTGLTETDCNFD